MDCEYCSNVDLIYKAIVDGRDSELCISCAKKLVCGRCNIPLDYFKEAMPHTKNRCSGCDLFIYMLDCQYPVMYISVEDGSLEWGTETK